jgi:hypothetical protein
MTNCRLAPRRLVTCSYGAESHAVDTDRHAWNAVARHKRPFATAVVLWRGVIQIQPLKIISTPTNCPLTSRPEAGPASSDRPRK